MTQTLSLPQIEPTVELTAESRNDVIELDPLSSYLCVVEIDEEAFVNLPEAIRDQLAAHFKEAIVNIVSRAEVVLVPGFCNVTVHQFKPASD